MAWALRRASRTRRVDVSAVTHRRLLPISWLDFKLGIRMLGRYPGLTLVAGFAMAFTVWVGAGTFEIVMQVLRPRIPLDEGDRIVVLQLVGTETREPEGRIGYDFSMWRTRLESVEDLGAFAHSYVNVVLDDDVGDPVLVASMTASGFHSRGSLLSWDASSFRRTRWTARRPSRSSRTISG